MAIKSISVEYDSKNSQNVFRRGDTITGRVLLVISKQTTIQSFSVRAIGAAKVMWDEDMGDVTVFYQNYDEIFSMENSLLQQGRDGTETLSPGRHERRFSFQIPDSELPISWEGEHGKICYSLKAKVTRSMRKASKAKTRFTVVSNADMSLPDLMKPQERTTIKKLTCFASGNINLSVHTERMGFLQGEALKVKVDILNNSSRSVTPKFYLYEKQSFHAKMNCNLKKRKLAIKDILKEKGEVVSARSGQNVTRVLSIPAELPPSILNCSILQLEYRLKVVLEVAHSKNPVVKMPIVVLDKTEGSASLAVQETLQRQDTLQSCFS